MERQIKRTRQREREKGEKEKDKWEEKNNDGEIALSKKDRKQEAREKWGSKTSWWWREKRRERGGEIKGEEEKQNKAEWWWLCKSKASFILIFTFIVNIYIYRERERGFFIYNVSPLSRICFIRAIKINSTVDSTLTISLMREYLNIQSSVMLSFSIMS